MHKSPLSFAILSIMGLASAIPTPASVAPRCGTTLVPSFLQPIVESDPTNVFPNSLDSHGHFAVSQDVDAAQNVVNRVYGIVGFDSIPAGSYGCQLAVTFPADYAPFGSSGNPILNVTTLFNDSPADLKTPNDYSWNKFFPPTSPPLGQGLFGTVTLERGTTKVINSENCPAGGNGLGFLVSIAGWERDAASVEFDQSFSPVVGFYLTYNC